MINSFPHEIRQKKKNTVYATVRELEEDTKYVVDTELCSDASEPNYKLTYHFSASNNQPLATLEIDEDFYTSNKDQMSGLCIDNSG